MGKALVVPHVQVGFSAVFGDIHLSVFKGRHCAGIHIDIGVQLLNRDFEAALFKKDGNGAGRDSFPKGRNHTASNEDELGHVEGASC